MPGVLKKLALILGGVLALLVIVGAALPFLIPASQYKAQIEKAAGEATGRELKIAGPLRFSLWPNLALRAQDVTLANAQGAAAPLFASIAELEIGVALMPLFKGDVQVTKLMLRKPSLWLEEDVAGKPNWVFEPKASPAQQPQAGAPGELKKLGLGDVRIADGAVSYRDKAGKTTAVSAVNAQVSLASLDAPLSIAGDLVYNQEKAAFTVAFAHPRAFLEKAGTPLEFTLAAPKLAVDFKGVLDTAAFALNGKLDAKGQSLRELAAWSGNPIGPGGGMGAFGAAGDFAMAGERFALKNAQIALDAAKGQGDLTIVMKPQAAPYVSGALRLAALDVNPYLAAPAQTGAGAANAAQGVDVNAPWGNAAIDLSGLKAVDADLKLITGQLLFQKMKIDSADLDLKMRAGVMQAQINKFALYGGTGSGQLTLDGSAVGGMKMANRLSVKGVAAEPFLTDAIGFSKVSGRASIDMTIAGSGRTQQAVMNALSGKASFTFDHGALKGVNLAQVAREIQSVLTGGATGAGAQTDFAELGADFTIQNGVAHTENGRMLNPFIRVTSTGDINLANQTLALKIQPRLVKTAEGQGGALGATTFIEAPFIAQGPWAKIGFDLDRKALAAAAGDKVKQQIEKKLGGSDLGSVLLGKKNADGSNQGGLLDQLLKKKSN
ncbi:MAG: AsmA family protein [Hyphomonadaceae bacterium]